MSGEIGENLSWERWGDEESSDGENDVVMGQQPIGGFRNEHITYVDRSSIGGFRKGAHPPPVIYHL